MPPNCKHRSLELVIALAVGTLATVALPTTARAADAPRVTPSGLEVPRYVSLKYDRINARNGPDEAHRLLWVYRAKGLPVQVVAETREWRRICDPEGGLSWVHKRVTDGRRTVMRIQPAPLALLASPRDGARISAWLRGRSTANLDKCEKGWCRLKAEGSRGWARESEIWGAAPAVQCKS